LPAPGRFPHLEPKQRRRKMRRHRRLLRRLHLVRPSSDNLVLSIDFAFVSPAVGLRHQCCHVPQVKNHSSTSIPPSTDPFVRESKASPCLCFLAHFEGSFPAN